MDTQPLPKTPEALRTAIATAENAMRQLRFQASANQLKRVREIRTLRVQIARLHSALTAALA